MRTTPPLRRVVRTTYVPAAPGSDVMMDADVLECGHTVLCPLDRNGSPTSARRRRCRHCAAELALGQGGCGPDRIGGP